MYEERVQETFIVLVYGTLKRGFSNYRRLLEGRSRFLGTTVIKGTMYSLQAFPAVQLTGNHDIHAEAFEIDGETLKRLDALEGCPGFYQRSQSDSKFGPAFIYTMNNVPSNSPVVESGNWI